MFLQLFTHWSFWLLVVLLAVAVVWVKWQVKGPRGG